MGSEYPDLLSSKLKEKVRKEYDREDAWQFDKSPDKNIYKHEFNEISKLICPNNRIVLDIGSGRGRFVDILSKNCDHVVCVDFSYSLLKVIKTNLKSGNIHLVMADAENLPFKDESFDLVLGIQVFGHLPSLKKSLREAGRVLSKGKSIIISLGNIFCLNEIKTRYLLIKKAYRQNFKIIMPYFKNDVIFWLNQRNFCRYSFLYIRRIVRQEGFQVVKVSGAGIIRVRENRMSRLIEYFSALTPFKYVSRFLIISCRKTQ